MFLAALRSFPDAEKYVFLCRESFLHQYPFEREIRRHYGNAKIIPVRQDTQGQACTCLLAEKEMLHEGELLISSIDYQIVYPRDVFEALRADQSVDAIVFTFHLNPMENKNPEGFAYCRIEGNRVIEVVEKKTISDTPENDHAVVGSFYYRRAKEFCSSAKGMMEKDVRVNGEFYVGTSLNQLIKRGADVRILPVDKFICFGTPFELNVFHAWEEYFFAEKEHPYQGSPVEKHP
tara:strand:- start:1051 stop:1752 length:702 start_codon:yes stop_codon:yes gene_type:complete